MVDENEGIHNPMISIRTAQISDATSLMPLMEQLGYPTVLEALQAKIQTYSQNNTYQIFLAEKSSHMVGFIAFVCYEMFVYHQKCCRIEALIIDENHRGQGIGRELMQHIETFARQAGCKIIDFTSGVHRAKDGTHEFYKRMGYGNQGRHEKLYLRKNLC
jgi:GNAT superfamily N-acetyltransferase